VGRILLSLPYGISGDMSALLMRRCGSLLLKIHVLELSVFTIYEVCHEECLFVSYMLSDIWCSCTPEQAKATTSVAPGCPDEKKQGGNMLLSTVSVR